MGLSAAHLKQQRGQRVTPSSAAVKPRHDCPDAAAGGHSCAAHALGSPSCRCCDVRCAGTMVLLASSGALTLAVGVVSTFLVSKSANTCRRQLAQGVCGPKCCVVPTVGSLAAECEPPQPAEEALKQGRS